MKITLVGEDLNGGGAERILCRMANYWSNRGWDVSLVTTSQGNRPPFYQLDPRVNVSDLNLPGLMKASPPGVGLLKAFARMRSGLLRTKPQVVISFLDRINVRVLMTTIGTGIPVIVSERIDPSFTLMSPSWVKLRETFYPRAAMVVVQTRAGARYFENKVGQKLVVIPNQVTVPQSSHTLDVNGVGRGKKNIVGMGRLDKQKGFDLLILAFAAIAKDYPDWQLTIYGEGEERSNLEQLVASAGVSASVLLPGKTSDPAMVFKQAEIFVLSSRFEGFPNVLCEAMACGCASISTRCPTGPEEIVTDEVDGLLVPVEDVPALSNSLKRLIDDPDLRTGFKGSAPSIMGRYREEVVMDEWEKVVRSVAPTK
jgi:GalNAc-alpha-(1->4)-GalNAc-alpha-(1->3)-diNAcBac-PP-undecaprenol alpha-1,4-N-acetyl-D-galactosaminyltransferase